MKSISLIARVIKEYGFFRDVTPEKFSEWLVEVHEDSLNNSEFRKYNVNLLKKSSTAEVRRRYQEEKNAGVEPVVDILKELDPNVR